MTIRTQSCLHTCECGRTFVYETLDPEDEQKKYRISIAERMYLVSYIATMFAVNVQSGFQLFGSCITTAIFAAIYALVFILSTLDV